MRDAEDIKKDAEVGYCDDRCNYCLQDHREREVQRRQLEVLLDIREILVRLTTNG